METIMEHFARPIMLKTSHARHQSDEKIRYWNPKNRRRHRIDDMTLILLIAIYYEQVIID